MISLEEYDIIVVGGGVSALCFVGAYRLFDKESKILVIRKTERQLIPCSVPYLINSLSLESGALSDDFYKANNVDLLIDEVVSIDTEKKVVRTKSGKEFGYSKLVLALGTKPIRIGIPGIDLENVFLVDRDYAYMRELIEKIKNLKRVVIIGAGFVGMELADDLAESHEVYIVEMLDEALALVLDKEFGEIARKELEKRGVKFILSSTVEKIVGNNRVEGVIVKGQKIEADAVIVSVGIVPNTEILKNTKIRMDDKGHVIVDSLMRTSMKNIYAVGDMVEKKMLVSGEPVKAYFAPLATIEGRIAALGMLGKISHRRFSNATMAFLTKIGNVVLGAVGITESWAKRLGIKYYKVDLEAVDRHPGALKDSSKVKVRVLFGEDLRLIGVEATGSQTVSELINFATLLIQFGATAYDIIEAQIATHPKVTPSPPSYPIHQAALKVLALKEKS